MDPIRSMPEVTPAPQASVSHFETEELEALGAYDMSELWVIDPWFELPGDP